MALTPEDVVNKRFNPTKFREGYDQDEVDEFLDEVVVELRRIHQENEELRQRLVSSESRIAELQRSAASTPAAAPALAPAPAHVAAAPAQLAFDPNSMDPGNTNNLLQLARRLHEEHVREGMEKRDALIAEGHAMAARVVSDAEQTHRAQLQSLETECASLQRNVEELRTFEREYRDRLKGYIEGQLRELESASALTAATGSQPAVRAAPTPASAFQPAGGPGGYPAAPGQSDYPAYSQPSEHPGFAPGT